MLSDPEVGNDALAMASFALVVTCVVTFSKV